MKKILLFVLLLIGGGNFAGCNKDEEIDTSVGDPIQSVTPTIEISSFFDSAWTHLGDGSPKSFFPNNRQDVCALVNSDEEFRELYQGTDEIPYIDFQQYTLVIGKKKYYTKDGEKRGGN